MSAKNRTFVSKPTIGPLPGAVVSVAGLKLPVAAVALGISALVHGALFSALSLIPWTPAARTKPEIELARGDSAIQVMILSTPWPKPRNEIEEQPLVDEGAQDVPPSPDTMTPAIVKAELPETGEAESPPPANRDETVAARPAVPTSPPPGREEISGSDVPADRQQFTEVADDGSGEQTVAHTGQDTATSAGRNRVTGVEVVSKRKANRDHAPAVRKANEAPSHVDSAQPSEGDAGVDSGVEVLNLPRPKYPLISRRRGEEGVVLLQVEVLPSGFSGRIKVLSEPGYPRLRESAIEAASQARFRPAMRHGKPIKDVVRIPFRFVLR